MPNDSARVRLPEQVIAAQVVVMLPGQLELDMAIAPVEVLVQEGFRVFSLPATARLGLDELRGIFGDRIFLGVHDVADAEQARRVIDQEVGFAAHLAAFEAERELLDAGIAVLAGALTPLEAQQTWRRGVAAVQITPAGVFGNAYASQLSELLPGVALATRGADSSFEVRAWLGAGAQVAYVGGKLLGDALRGGDLGALRARAKPFTEARAPLRN